VRSLGEASAGHCVISGFHSPVEQECLRILLRGKTPIILCPARILPVRIPAEWQRPLAEGRMLLVSTFDNPRPTTAARRNLLAAFADEHWFAHMTPGGSSERLAATIARWPSSARP
jgi:hypothetical protein